jgi:hypothetical protein
MARKKDPVQIACTISLTLETDEGTRLTEAETREARDFLKDAIRNRLFGEGFLAPDILVLTWDVKHH